MSESKKKQESAGPVISMSRGDMSWNRTGNWTFFRPVHRERIAPCAMKCPLSVPVNRYMDLVRRERHREAWKILAEYNPMPAVTGRVCYHDCEGGCSRAELDEAINIHAVERFLGDLAIEKRWSLPAPRKEAGGLPVAVLGSGPAGLGCAYGLRKRGYQVVVCERESAPGGMLRVGVPEFRMPRKYLDAEITRLEKLGVEFRCERDIADLDEIFPETAALFVAGGAHGHRDPGIDGGDLGRVYHGLDFLKAYNAGRPLDTGKRLAIIGGGNTALDVARAGIRLGAKVDLYYRRTREEMPAHPEELDEAAGEGASFHFQVAPESLERGTAGNVAGVRLIRMKQGEPDESGRARPVPVEGSGFAAGADTVVFAIGEQPDLSYMNGRGLRDSGRLAVDALGRTSIPGVFAGGDIIPGENSVSHALADGMAAANNMALIFQSFDAGAPEEAPALVEKSMINLDYFDPAPRQQGPKIIREAPTGNEEAESTMTAEQAGLESVRCFNCGTCIDCDTCLVFCPDLAIYCMHGKDENYMVRAEFCKGCGICAEECPRSVISMEEKE